MTVMIFFVNLFLVKYYTYMSYIHLIIYISQAKDQVVIDDLTTHTDAGRQGTGLTHY